MTLRSPSPRPNLRYEYTASNGITYSPHRNGWSCNLRAGLQKYDAEGRLHFPSKAEGALRLKMYADEKRRTFSSKSVDDIPPISSQARERLGYPTQKPRALLERIVAASSDPGDMVLDPFCGCGTAVDAAQKLGRRWIGIDITHIAIGMIEDRMRSGYPGIVFETMAYPRISTVRSSWRTTTSTSSNNGRAGRSVATRARRRAATRASTVGSTISPRAARSKPE